MLLFAFSVCFGAQNWNSAADTAMVNDTITNAEVVYTKAFNLSDYEDVRAIMMVDDTTAAGFASDSVNFIWGYQTGNQVINASGAFDTIWDARVTIDTVATASFGTWAIEGTIGPSGALTRSESKVVDTTMVTGYAVQSKIFVPQWDMFNRYWIQGVTGNLTGGPNVYVVKQSRRLYEAVRSR